MSPLPVFYRSLKSMVLFRLCSLCFLCNPQIFIFYSLKIFISFKKSVSMVFRKFLGEEFFRNLWPKEWEISFKYIQNHSQKRHKGVVCCILKKILFNDKIQNECQTWIINCSCILFKSRWLSKPNSSMLRHLVDELKNVCLDKILIRQLPNVSLSWLRISV